MPLEAEEKNYTLTIRCRRSLFCRVLQGQKVTKQAETPQNDRNINEKNDN